MEVGSVAKRCEASAVFPRQSIKPTVPTFSLAPAHPGNSQYSPFLCVTVSTPTIDCEPQGGVNRCPLNVATGHNFFSTFSHVMNKPNRENCPRKWVLAMLCTATPCSPRVPLRVPTRWLTHAPLTDLGHGLRAAGWWQAGCCQILET